jgi:peptide/nickel transport system substrate-binding protein/oligopeptide transport system substrate-binding protein
MRFLPLLCTLLVLLAGCAVSSPQPSSSPSRTSLQWGVIGVTDIPTLDPALASDPVSISVASLVYGGLVRLDPRLKVKPDGAQRWTISPNGRTYTFYLRPNLRFPDGRRVTASDFASSLQRSMGPEGVSGTAPFYLSLIAHTPNAISVVNATTLRITIDHPAAHFLTELAFPAADVIDPSTMKRYGTAWTDHAAGFGPYYVKSWQHSQYLTLVRNPHYYAGRPPLRTLSLHFYPDEDGGMAAYRQHRVDVLSGLQPGQTIADPPPGTRRVPALAMDYLAFNLTGGPFARTNVRRAFAAAWTPGLVKQTMGDAAFPAQGFLPSAFGLSVPPWKPKKSPAQYLAAAHVSGSKFPPVVLIMPHDPYLHALGDVLISRWRRDLGVTVTARRLNAKDYGTVLDARSYGIALVRWGGDYPDTSDFLGTQLGGTSANVTGWSGRRFRADVALADSYSPDDPRRATLFRAASRYAKGHMPLLPLDEPAVTALIRGTLRGIYLTPLGTISGQWNRARYTG